jgi:outer membrane immunogenic protein
MKKIVLAATMAFAATPAMANEDRAANANFTGLRVGATAGMDNVTGALDTNSVVYGADAGVDFGIGNRVVVGVEVTGTNVFEASRTIGAAGRLGYAVTPGVMPYVRAGWANYRDVTDRVLNGGDAFTVDGLTVGGGVELAVTRNLYSKVEYRYSDFSDGIGNHGALVGVGLRF